MFRRLRSVLLCTFAVTLLALFVVVAPDDVSQATPSSAWGLMPGMTLGSNPTEIAAGPNGDLWVTDRTDGTLTHIVSVAGVPTAQTPLQLASGSQPTGVTVGADGDVWVADSAQGTLIRFTEIGGTWTEQSPISLATSGRTMKITTAPDGTIWVIFIDTQTVQRVANVNGTWTAESALTSDSQPAEFVTDSTGRLWITNRDSYITEAVVANGIGALQSSTFTGYWGRLAAPAPNGMLYMSDSGCRIYLFDPVTVTRIREGYPYCASNSIAATADGSVWLNERDVGNIVRWRPSNMTPIETIRVGGNTFDLTITSQGWLWFINGTTRKVQRFLYDTAVASTITSADSATFSVGVPSTFSVTTTGGFPTPRLRVLEPLPYGLSMTDNADGTATISGAVRPGAEGVYALTVQAVNGDRITTQQFTLTVPGTPPQQLTVFANGDYGGWATCSVNSITTTSGANLWVSDNSSPRILRYTTRPLSLTESFALPGSPAQIITATDGTVWYIDVTNNRVGSISLSNGVWTVDSTITTGSQPKLLTPGSDGSVWVIDGVDSTATKITNDGIVRAVSVSVSLPSGTPSGITTGADGSIWFGDRSTGSLLRIANPDYVPGVETPLALARSGSDMALATGPDGDIWVQFQGTPTVQGVKEVSGTWTVQSAITLPGNGFTVAAGPASTLWVGYPDGWASQLVEQNDTWVALDRISARGRTQYGVIADNGSMWWSDAGCAIFEWKSYTGVQPVVTSAPSGTMTVGSWSSIGLTATGTPNVQFSVVGTLPDGVYFNADQNTSTGSFGGSPSNQARVGDYELVVVADNGAYRAAVQYFTLTVQDVAATTTTTESTTTTTESTTTTSTSTTTSSTSTSTTSSTVTSTTSSTVTSTTSTTTVPVPALTEAQVTQLPPSNMTSSRLGRGRRVSLRQRGFRPRERVQIMVASSPIVLGEFEADDDGAIDVEVELPADLEIGTHHLATYGLTSGVGFSQEFVIDATDDGSALPTTGSDSRSSVGFALVLVGLGGAMAVTARRRRARP